MVGKKKGRKTRKTTKKDVAPKEVLDKKPTAMHDDAMKEAGKIYNEYKMNFETVEELQLNLLAMLSVKHPKRGLITEKVVKFLEKNYYVKTVRGEKEEMWIYNPKMGVYEKDGDKILLEKIREIFQIEHDAYWGKRVLEKIKRDTGINQEEFFNHPPEFKIPCKNGLLNIKTGELTEFTPEEIHLAAIPVTFDSTAKCSEIENHFAKVLKYPDDKEVIYELVGYCLWKGYPIHKCAALDGTGNNGKSVTLNLIEAFLGKNNVTHLTIQEVEENNYASGDLIGKLANLGPELPQTTLRKTTKFKALTSGAPISSDRKYKDRLEGVSYAKQLFACNDLPMSLDDSFAFFRRWIIIDFPFTFVMKEEFEKMSGEERKEIHAREADMLIEEKLISEVELSGLLNKALEGVQRLIKNREFSDAKCTQDIRERYERKSCSLVAFLYDKTEEGNEEDYIIQSELKQRFRKFCKMERLIMKPTKTNEMDDVLLKFRGASPGRKREDADGPFFHIWKGIKWKKGGQQNL